MAERLLLAGQVQGVGFRPFVYRLAHRHGLLGSVRNRVGEVEILAYGTPSELDSFRKAVIDDAPPLAQPRLISASVCEFSTPRNFEILPSDETSDAKISVPADFFTCSACLDELHSAANRRFEYPFINCTECGPRYTLIRQLPYDRANTSMASFELCEQCRSEYENPVDRRFHAEPVGCPECGPQLDYRDPCLAEPSVDALASAAAAIIAGRIVAVKGVGGYHLVCDARNENAVRRLRQRKQRPDKPLAVMFPMVGGDGLDAVRAETRVSWEAAEVLADPKRPIVLVQKLKSSALSSLVAPGLAEFGVFLPYSPLHDLLLHRCRRPLVATSGNISGEPVLTDNGDAERRLGQVADSFLHHNRPIVRPADDSVYRMIGGRPRPLRLGRGAAPLELSLPVPVCEPVLALGGQQKNTVALAWEDRVVVSPHIGDMGTVRSTEVFEQVVAELQTLYRVKAKRLVCDAHPGYETHRWARLSHLPVTTVQHHRAHASSLFADIGLDRPCLVLTWDGVGYGSDATLWGGETFYGQPGAWRRVASLRTFALPGGERAGREPWRSAAGLSWETGREYMPSASQDGLARMAWQRGLNSPRTSAVGRLFDGFAALVLGITDCTYEGQAAMELESSCGESGAALRLPFGPDAYGICRVNWEPLIALALDESQPRSQRARSFHLSLAQCVVDQAQYFRAVFGIDSVGLSGGVFQNRYLSEAAMRGLHRAGFKVHLSERVPCNDGGLSVGQVVEYAASVQRTAPDNYDAGNRDSRV